MSVLDLKDFNPKMAQILSQLKSRQAPPPLVPKEAWNPKLREELNSLDLEELFETRKLTSIEFAQAVKSGLYLWNDCLSESHSLSQKIEDQTGSYWHGIMHRREPDYSNSKYWFRRVGNHPIFLEVYKSTLEIFSVTAPNSDWAIWASEKAEYLKKKGEWDAFAYVDWCQEAEDRKGKKLLEHVQLREIELLFSYSYAQAR